MPVGTLDALRLATGLLWRDTRHPYYWGMPKRSSRRRQDEDAKYWEPDVSKDGKNPAAVALGRLGGKKGGPARAAKLTPDERSEIARTAALARWRKAKNRDKSD